MALSKTERLPRALVNAKGIRRACSYGSLKLLPPPPRAAVVVSKKIFKTAPLRNRVRRRVAGILRGFVRAKILTRAVVAYPNAAALSAPHAELTAALLRAVSS